VARLLNLLRRRRDRLERDLDRELRYHMDRRVDDLIADGLGAPEARRRASIEFGGVPQVQEAVRDTWMWRWLDALRCDVRYAMRTLIKSPGFTLGAGAVLALAIGATTAIFSVVNSVLLQPLPYPDAERLVSIETFWINTGRASQDVSGPDFLDWQAKSDAFEKMAVLYSNADEAIFLGDRAVFGNAADVSADFFAVFAQTPSVGRLLTAGDVPAGREAQPNAAVVAHYWAAAQFGGTEAALGKTITVYGNVMEIVGVAAPGFRYPGATDIWAAMRPTNHPANRSDHPYRAVGKLKEDVALAQAQSQMRAIGETLARQYPENRLKTATVIPLQERLTGNLQATLWVLMSAVGVLWLIGCANIANLLLARAAGRTREIALRAALGAGRGRVVRQLLTESCLLAGVAGLSGLLMTSMLLQTLVALAPVNLPRIEEVRIDKPVLLFALTLSLVSTVLFGLVPAVQAARLDLSGTLKQGAAKTTGTRASVRIRSALVVAEVALSIVLLVTAGLLLRSFQTLQHVDLGFTKERVLVADTVYAVRDGVREDLWIRSRFYADVLDRLRSVPGVRAASGVAYLGMGRERRLPRDFFIQGRPEGRAGERPQAEHHAITADYFKTLEIPVRAGRDFDTSDTPERTPVAIINDAMARMAFPGEAPLGQRIRVNSRSRWMEIVGVVADTRWQDPSHAPPPVVFSPSTQGWGNSLTILARTSVDERSLASTLRTLMHGVNPTVPVKIETMEELFDSALAYPRFRTQVIGLFAGAAAVLAGVGIFSVLAYLVGQRTRELAVRRALGAGTADVIRLVVGQGLRLVAMGLALGLAGALAVTRLLAGLLYAISPWDVATYVGTIVVLGFAALVATLLPAIRAATIAPVIALQQE
jgi:putative ABC transport system permease protein